FGQSVLPADEGVVLGNGVILAFVLLVDIDAEDLGQQSLEVLAVFERIVGRAAVPQGNVKIAIRTEADGAAVVVPERPLLDAEQHLIGGGIGTIRIVLADPEATDHIGSQRFLQRIEDEELTGLLVLGMKRQAEEALFVFVVIVAHAVLNIEKDLGLVCFLI